MEGRTGSVTVAALLGTGLATIGFALSGVSALGDDLRVAARDARPTTPVLTPDEERVDAPSPTSPPPASEAELRQLLRDRDTGLTLKQACLERERRAAQREARGRAERTSPTATATPQPAPTLASPASGREL